MLNQISLLWIKVSEQESQMLDSSTYYTKRKTSSEKHSANGHVSYRQYCLVSKGDIHPTLASKSELPLLDTS